MTGRPANARLAARVDANQAEIVSALKQIVGSDNVFNLKEPVDLMVAYGGRNILMEVKGEKGKLTPKQDIFFNNWQGQVDIVRNVQDAIDVINKATKRRR